MEVRRLTYTAACVRARRLWSVAHSTLRPHTLACANDNGMLRLWVGRGLAECAVEVSPGKGPAVCGVAFSSLDEHLLAAACADSNAYVYDLRHMASPLHVRSPPDTRLCQALWQEHAQRRSVTLHAARL